MCPCGLWVRGDDKLHSVPPNCSRKSRTAASSSSQGGQQVPPSTAGPWLTSGRGGGGAGRPRSSSWSQQGDPGRAGPLARPRGRWGTSFPGAVCSDPTQPLRDPRRSVFCTRETGSSGKGRAPSTGSGVTDIPDSGFGSQTRGPTSFIVWSPTTGCGAEDDPVGKVQREGRVRTSSWSGAAVQPPLHPPRRPRGSCAPAAGSPASRPASPAGGPPLPLRGQRRKGPSS